MKLKNRFFSLVHHRRHRTSALPFERRTFAVMLKFSHAIRTKKNYKIYRLNPLLRSITMTIHINKSQSFIQKECIFWNSLGCYWHMHL